MSLITYESLVDGTPITANVFNERFGQIVSVLNGGLDSNNFLAGGIPAAALAASVYERVYPVGSLYFNATSITNPSELLGIGTWVAFGTGRVIVGYDASDSDFNLVEKTGGAKTTVLTTDNLPSHTHTVNPPSTATGGQSADHTHFISNKEMTYAAGSSPSYRTIGSANSANQDYIEDNYTSGTSGNHTHTVDIAEFTSGATGTGTGHSNMAPFITVYCWKRTA